MLKLCISALGLAALLGACGGASEPSVLTSAAPNAVTTGPSMASVLNSGGGQAAQSVISESRAEANPIAGGTLGVPLSDSIGVAAEITEPGRARALAVTRSSVGATTDLIWHNATTGQTASWAMNGTSTTSSTVLLQAPAWKVTRTADLNGDGQQDLIWENASTHQIVAWLMNGSQTLQSTVLLQSAGWKITHTADFNGDGKSDLLFHNASTGQTVLWLMNGTTVLSSQILFTSTAWQVSLVADLNGDNKADLIWHNSQTSQTAAWLMNGTAVNSSALLLELANWRVTQVGDLDGDSQDDLIWTNTTTGQTVAWLMNGLSTSNSTLLFTHPRWRVSRVADLDGDGQADLIWANSATSEVAGWLMTGVAIKSNTVLLANASWQVSNVVDLNGDGKQDLIWRNATSGQTVAWVMNGLSAASQTTLLTLPNWVVVGARSKSTAPLANPGAAQSVATGSMVALDGTVSSAPTGAALSYVWTLSDKPAGSTATLSNGSTARPSFIPDFAGLYRATMLVSDGSRVSSAVTVEVTANGNPVPPPSGEGTLADFSGTYSFRTEDVSQASFFISNTGEIGQCKAGSVVNCRGQLSVNPVNGEGSFQVSGNDGLSPVDTTATLTGSIRRDGSLVGTYVGYSTSEGSFSGNFTGFRLPPAPGARTLKRITIMPSSDNLKGTSVAARMPTSSYAYAKAIGTYSDGSTADITSSVEWGSSNQEAAGVSNAEGFDAKIVGYIMPLGESLQPKYPFGIWAASTIIKAKDPQTRIEGNMLLTVERGLDEGSSEIPLRVAVALGPLPPDVRSIQPRESFTAGLQPGGSWYTAEVKPLGLYAVELNGLAAPLSMFAGAQPFDILQSCYDSTTIFGLQKIGCIAKADANGLLRLVVGPQGSSNESSPVTFVMQAREIKAAALVTVGTKSAPVITELNKEIGVGPIGCSHYRINTTQINPFSLTFRSMTDSARIIVTANDTGSLNMSDTFGVTDVNFMINSAGGRVDIQYCSSSAGTYYGSTAQITVP